jgi:hypothetical protein
MNQMDRAENEKDEIIFPTNFRLRSGCKIYPQHICKEECCERVGRALRTQMGWKDFGGDSVLVYVDECAVAGADRLTLRLSWVRNRVDTKEKTYKNT